MAYSRQLLMTILLFALHCGLAGVYELAQFIMVSLLEKAYKVYYNGMQCKQQINSQISD